MLLAFLESIKYIGQMIPLALFRLFIGYYYLRTGWSHYGDNYWTQPHHAQEMIQNLDHNALPLFYNQLVEDYIFSNWTVFAYWFLFLEICIGFGFLFGFLVRPLGIIAFLMCLHQLLFNFYTPFYGTWLLLCAINLTFVAVGAGRCLGLDYFFYKRHRGLWW